MEQKYEYTPIYYGTPCQVRYYDTATATFIGGIGFHDYIICGCCGNLFTIDNIIQEAEKANINWDQAVVELKWIDISEEIKGE